MLSEIQKMDRYRREIESRRLQNFKISLKCSFFKYFLFGYFDMSNKLFLILCKKVVKMRWRSGLYFLFGWVISESWKYMYNIKYSWLKITNGNL